MNQVKEVSICWRGGANRQASKLETEKVLFEDLIRKVNEEYALNNKQISEASLPWINNLKLIINSNSNLEGKEWQLIQQEWKSCDVPEKTMENFCGFVYLKKGTIEYKLKIARDNERRWTIVVVQNEDNQISFYDNYDRQWKIQGQDNFKELGSYQQINSDVDSWQRYQNGIIFSQ